MVRRSARTGCRLGNRLAHSPSVGYLAHEVRGASITIAPRRRSELRNPLAKALAAVAVLGTALALPARAAEKKAGRGSKAIDPKIVIVVECVRRTDVKAARDFIAYMTREPRLDIMVADEDGKAKAVASQRERFIASASLSSARKAAEREKAVGIVHVKIIKRAVAVRGGSPEMQANCSAILPTTARGSRRLSWKVKKARILPSPPKAGIVLIGGLAGPDEPPDFVKMKQEITQLIYDAAVEVAMARIIKEPKRGESVKATITNNTLLEIAGLTISNASHGKLCRWKYSGDALPPGKNKVTLEARLVRCGHGRIVVPDQPARVEIVSFAEAAAKK